MTDPSSLIRRAKSGDSEAFDELYQLFFTPIYRYLLAETRHRETAEDIAQTVFTKAWQHLNGATANEQENSRAYFFRIARTTLIDHQRKRHEILFDETTSFDHLPAAENPREDLERNEDRKRVMQALSALPEEQKTVLSLRFIGSASHEETAAATGKSATAVRQIQHRALKKLALLLTSHI